jgi:NAD(P)-dependent dehydrogenase (short-subunit alcohol dehydrogenase family)
MPAQPATRPTAFVTGASYGVGAATAVALARAGFDVAVSAREPAHLDSTLAALAQTGARSVPIVLDLHSQASVEAAAAAVLSAFGTVDVLVNNAGANLRKSAVDVTWSEWDEVMAVNLRGAFFLSREFARRWIATQTAGNIVNIASTHALVGAAERSVYGTSKAGLVQMTRMLAVEWAPHRIRVNAIAPGRLDTSSPSRAARTADPSYMAAMRARIPLGRLATVEEVAAAVYYLAGAGAASITGQTLVLDGGLTVA